MVKLLDYNERWAELKASANPFAMVVMAHLKARATRKDSDSRLRWKLRLVRQLYERGWNRRKVIELFRFIDWVLALPRHQEKRFIEKHERFEMETKMRYITSVERLGREKWLQEGDVPLGVRTASQYRRVIHDRTRDRRVVSTRLSRCSSASVSPMVWRVLASPDSPARS